MRLFLPSEVEVPVEIIREILHHLSQRNLKRVRLVCVELGAIARPLLFKSISISPVIAEVDRFLNIIRDSELSRAVEELVYKEAHISKGETDWITGLEGDPYETVIHRHYQGEMEDETEITTRRKRIHDILGQIRQEYEDQAAGIKSGYDFGALVEGLLAMRNLKRIITRDSRPSGIGTDSAFKPPSLGTLQAYFPATESSLRLLTYPEPLESPDHGFLTILRALAATGADIDILVTERTTGFLKRGISFLRFSKKELFYQEYVRGFGHLRKVSLCVDDNWGNDPTGSKAQDIALSAFILAASHLEHLELSVTHRNAAESCLPLRCLLPSTSLRNLHTLVLEGIRATAREMTSFLVPQATNLRHLALCNVQLLTDDLWEHVLAVLRDCTAFRLDSFVLKSPVDADVLQHEEDWEVAARIPNEEVLRFVNEGGINPFAKRDWRSQPPVDSDFEAASDVSDVSDFSAWRRCRDDSSDVDKDPDGPEFHSDYDTDPEVDSELSDYSGVDEW